MSNADKAAPVRSPRRMFLALLGAVPALAATLSQPTKAAIQDPDFHLLRLVEAWHAAGEFKGWESYQEQVALRAQALRSIAGTPARTARGALAKARMCIECAECVMHSDEAWRSLAKGAAAETILLEQALL